jgi:hypothetical protein
MSPSMPVSEEVYEFTPAFWRWLDRRKPGAAKVLRRQGITSAKLWDAMTRVRLRFDLDRFLPENNSADFDWVVRSPHPIMLLDGHPEEVAHGSRPDGSQYNLPMDYSQLLGLQIEFDTKLLLRRASELPAELQARPTVTGRVVARRGHLLQLLFGNSYTVLFDEEELVTYTDLCWQEAHADPNPNRDRDSLRQPVLRTR